MSSTAVVLVWAACFPRIISFIFYFFAFTLFASSADCRLITLAHTLELTLLLLPSLTFTFQLREGTAKNEEDGEKKKVQF